MTGSQPSLIKTMYAGLRAWSERSGGLARLDRLSTTQHHVDAAQIYER